MKVEKKVIFCSLGGLAVLGAATYYLTKRKNNTPPIDPLQQIQWYSKRFWDSPINKLSSIEQTLKRVLDQLLGVRFKQANYQSEIETNVLRNCRKQLKGSHFYECQDCTPLNIVPTKKSGGDLSGNSYAHTICEDCFDQEIHKGHRYRLVPSFQDNFCDCGCSLLLKEKSFCKMHQGYSSLLKEYNIRGYQEGEEEERQQYLLIFKELFYNLVDGFAENYHKVTKNLKKDQKIGVNEITLHFNIFLRIIFNLINDTLQYKSELLYLFIDLLQQTFDKPLRIDTSKDDIIETLNEKRIDKSESIYGYLARLLFFQSKQNEQSFSNLVIEMSLADVDFNIYISSHFVKNHRFYLLTDQMTIHKSAFEYKYFSNVSSPILNSLSINTFPFQLISQNLPSIEKILTFYGEYIKSLIPEFIENEFSIPFTLEQIIICLIKDESIQNNEKYLKLLFQKLIVFQNQCFSALTLKIDKKQDHFMNYLTQLNKYFLQCSLQSFFGQIIEKVIANVKKSHNKQAEEIILDILTSQLLSFIDNFLKELEEQVKKEGILYYVHYGTICMSLLIFIIQMSCTSLTQQGLINGLMKSFKFQEKDQLTQLINQIYSINTKFITINQTEFGLLPILAQNFCSRTEVYQGMTEAQYQTTVSSEFGLYDNSIFSMQLLILIQPEICNIITHDNMEQIAQAGQQEAQFITRMFKHTIYIYQLIFDQTPFLNFFYQNQEYLSDISVRDKKILESGVNEVLSQLIQYFYSSSIEQQMFHEKIKHVFKFNVKEELEKITKFNQITQALELQEENKKSKDFSNLSRFGLDLRNNGIDGQLFKNYSVVCQRDIFNKLYEYQISILIELVAQPETFKLVVGLIDTQFASMIGVYRLQFYFILLLHEQDKIDNNFLTESQKKRVQESIKILQSQPKLIEAFENETKLCEDNILQECIIMLKANQENQTEQIDEQNKINSE